MGMADEIRRNQRLAADQAAAQKASAIAKWEAARPLLDKMVAEFIREAKDLGVKPRKVGFLNRGWSVPVAYRESNDGYGSVFRLWIRTTGAWNPSYDADSWADFADWAPVTEATIRKLMSQFLSNPPLDHQ